MKEFSMPRPTGIDPWKRFVKFSIRWVEGIAEKPAVFNSPFDLVAFIKST